MGGTYFAFFSTPAQSLTASASLSAFNLGLTKIDMMKREWRKERVERGRPRSNRHLTAIERKKRTALTNYDEQHQLPRLGASTRTKGRERREKPK